MLKVSTVVFASLTLILAGCNQPAATSVVSGTASAPVVAAVATETDAGAKPKLATLPVDSPERQAYRQGFQELTTVADYELFIYMFGEDDPEQLVPKATLALEALKKQG